MEHVMSLLHHYGYVLIFAVLALEGTGMPGVPLEFVFLGAGYLIETGRMSFLLAVTFATLGNVSGNLVGYLVGVASRGLVHRDTDRGGKGRRGFIRPEDFATVGRWFAKYGALTVFIGRWFGPIRTPAILASGLMGLDIWKYLAASALGASTWCFVWQLATWKLGAEVLRFMKPATYLEVLRLPWEIWALVIAAIAIGGYLMWRRVRRAF